MNNQFREYVNSATFSLSLSRNMIVSLLSINNMDGSDERLLTGTYNSLINRGLLERTDKGISITDEGRLVARLLIMSGY